jgi:hypothetical protein
MSAVAQTPNARPQMPAPIASSDEELQYGLQAVLDMYGEGDWERMEGAAAGLVQFARRKRLEAAASAAGCVKQG